MCSASIVIGKWRFRKSGLPVQDVTRGIEFEHRLMD